MFSVTFIVFFMFAAFLVIFVFPPLVLLFGSLDFHYPRSFVLRVRFFLHIVYLAFIVIFRVSPSSVALGPVYSLMFGFFARPSFSSLSRYRLVSISFVSFAFLDCLIAFVQFVGCFILTLYLFNCYFSVPLYFAILHIGSLVSLHQL